MEKHVLFSLNSNGSIQQWAISVQGNVIIKEYGQVGGAIQKTTDTIEKGKNTGKANATTPETQALAEAQAQWEKKLKSGYTKTESEARQGKVDKEFVTGGISPMLAHKFKDHEEKVIYPAFSQPKLDGCVHGSSILQTDLGPKTIKEIVDNKIECKVLSYNIKTNKNEYKDISNWFNNGLANYQDWIYIKLSNNHLIKCTKNHKIYTNNGWKRADSLNPHKDLILADRGSHRLFSLIIGTILGDSSVSIEKRTQSKKPSYRFSFSHAKKDLALFKANVLNMNFNIIKVTSGYGSKLTRVISPSLTNTDFPITRMYQTGHNKNQGKRKIINHKFLLKYVTDESLSMWIADDGCLRFNNKNKFTPVLDFHTQGFCKEQINQFILFFKKKYGCIPRINKDKKVKNGSGIFLTLNTKDTLFILNRLRNLQCQGAEYKYYFPTEGYIKPVENKFSFFKFKICGSRKQIPQVKYDIEVKDNHNYFANKILVHNCRTVAIINNETCSLWSRTQKPIVSVPHIIKALEATFQKQNIVLDGELYNHKLKQSFEEIVSFIRCKEPKQGHEIIEYHVYDLIDDTLTFKERTEKLNSIKFASSKIVKVETKKINDVDELMDYFTVCRNAGYEGCMARNSQSLYKHARSYDLQKIKEMDDGEYEIIGVEAGRGRMKECGIFICRTKEGQKFNCKMEGSLDALRTYLSNPKGVISKMLTVRYQGLTNGGVPRFPIGVSVRDYE